MRLFHLSDLHIGLKLLNRDMREDQEYIFGQIVALAAEKRPDAIVIAGDIYDKSAPSAEAVEVFDRFVVKLREAAPEAAVMMISGNHDSPSRLDCFRNVLAGERLYMIGKPPVQDGEFMEKIVLRDAYGKVNFYLLPFVRPSMVQAVVGTKEDGSFLSYQETIEKLIEREKIDREERNVFVSHQFYVPEGVEAKDVERMDMEVRTVGNVDAVGAGLLSVFDYAALGHIHKPMKVGSERIRYCGTPLAVSVSEAGQEKGVVMVDLQEKGTVHITKLPLKPLREVRVIKGELAEVLEFRCEDYVTVILTDRADLDVIDMRERLRLAFPNLLEIKRETKKTADYEREIDTEALPDPFALCCLFLKDMDEQDQAVMQDVINVVKGAL
ncbi:MAG: exonuclease SbcCD subunit D [Lachnospiraceae bacterium]|nr:exonuclease SbcCD subunit D [Lachnospiraceae bacterium]